MQFHVSSINLCREISQCYHTNQVLRDTFREPSSGRNGVQCKPSLRQIQREDYVHKCAGLGAE
jgi:hypothetical protein